MWMSIYKHWHWIKNEYFALYCWICSLFLRSYWLFKWISRLCAISRLLWQSTSVVTYWAKLIKIRWYQICAVILFFVAWRKQFESHKIFAELKTKMAHNHSIPHGGWFQYVSCPHYFAEILIYLSLAIILGTNHQTGWLVFVWVLTNQIIAGLMSHWWYQKTFPNYPTRRKAVIPYVL